MKLPFDGHTRRRIYLVRHGQSGPTKTSDGIYGDSITLTPTGIAEAQAMRDFLAEVEFDEAFSSDIGRTIETAAIILEGRNLKATPSARFTEIRADFEALVATKLTPSEMKAAFAYALWTADSEKACLLGGDVISAYLESAGEAISSLVRQTTASTLLLVSHSGFQRSALCWALDAPARGMASFEQDTCCVNILDIDLNPDGEVVRKHVRLANLTPLDLTKSKSRLTDSEQMAVRLLDGLGQH